MILWTASEYLAGQANALYAIAKTFCVPPILMLPIFSVLVECSSLIQNIYDNKVVYRCEAILQCFDLYLCASPQRVENVTAQLDWWRNLILDMQC